MSPSRHYQVSRDDEINQVLRVVKESGGAKLHIVVPDDVELFQNEINLRLLNAYAKEAGAEVVLITDDGTTRRQASKYGIPVRPSVLMGEAGEGDTSGGGADQDSEAGRGAQEPVDETPPRRAGWTRRIAVLVIVVGALSGLFFTVAPKVYIAVVPEYEHMQVTLLVEKDEAVQALFRTAEEPVRAAVAVPVQGQERVGVTRARGVVVLVNAGDKDVTIPAGTEVATQSGTVFLTDEEVTVPGRTVTYFLDVPVGVQAGRAEVRVTAAEPGSEGNVAPERIRVLRGPWQDVSVRNFEPLTGGTDAVHPVVTEADHERAVAQAAEAVDRERRAYVDRWSESHPGRAVLVTEWAQLPATVVEPSVGSRSDTVEAVSEGVASILWVDMEDFRDFVVETIPERVPIGYTWERTMGFVLSVAGYDGEQGMLRLQADVPLRPVLDTVSLAQRIAGRPVGEAITQLLGERGIAAASVHPASTERLPVWAPWIRITVEER